MQMGIPIIFSSKSMLALNCTTFNVELSKKWVYDTFEEGRKIIDKCLADVNYAKEISVGQREILEKAFSRDTALTQVKNIFNKVIETKC